MFGICLENIGCQLGHEEHSCWNCFDYEMAIQFRKMNADNVETFNAPDDEVLPSEIDWRKEGAVTLVESQKKCGSCWAFSAVGAIEGAHFLETGELIMLSKQQVIDCSADHGNKGCKGGHPEKAFEYVVKSGGIASDADYPYENKMLACRYKPANKTAEIKDYITIPSDDEEALKAAVALFGPVSVCIYCSEKFYLYKEGVFHEHPRKEWQLNHAALVVGYGTTKEGVDYWLVKNSWGPTWGEDGYIRVVRNRDNNIGIASLASFPRAQDETDPVD